MFFVFESGNPQDGEAAGGLGDMHRAFDNLVEATEFSESEFYSTENVEILDGSNGDIIQTIYGQDGWHRSPREAFSNNLKERKCCLGLPPHECAHVPNSQCRGMIEGPAQKERE